MPRHRKSSRITKTDFCDRMYRIGMYRSYHYGNEYYMQPTEPLVWQEHNHHGGILGVVRSSRFRDFPNLVFRFPPITFATHEMDNDDWTLEIRQRSSRSRARVKIFDRNNFGFR